MAILIPMALTGWAAIVDLRTREIPNEFPAFIFVSGTLMSLAGLLPISFPLSLAGAFLALGLGCILFRIGAWGGGDVKLLVGLGAWLGPAGLLALFLWTGLLGAVLAIISAWRGKKDFALAPAIAGGLIVHLLWPSTLTALLAG